MFDHSRLRRGVITAALVLGVCPLLTAQQAYVGKYDAYVGYSFLNSPAISLPEHGFHVQVGFRPRVWYSMGFDYSRLEGDMTIKPDMLLPSLQTTLGGQLAALAAAGRLPAGYSLAVPTSSTTQTFAAGPQLALHKYKAVTLFVRPSMGAIYEVATPHPGDPIATGIVAQLSPEGKKTDWKGFFGGGGGFDLNITKHFALRFQADVVWDHLFDDLLKSGRTSVRFSVGPGFQWGKNVR